QPDRSRVHNFFFSDHSLARARADNLRRQVALNYPELLDRLKAAEAGATAGPDPSGRPTSEPSVKHESDHPTLDLWVDRAYSSWENPFESELSINGELVDVFTSDRTTPVGDYVKTGWNTVAIKTTPQVGVSLSNGLRFRLGPARPGARRG